MFLIFLLYMQMFARREGGTPVATFLMVAPKSYIQWTLAADYYVLIFNCCLFQLGLIV